MLRLYLFGEVTISMNTDAPLNFRTRKANAILCHLAVTGMPVPRIKLAELFWPKMTTRQALKNLRTVLPELRQLLGDYLIVTPQQVALNRELPHWVDLYELRLLLSEESRVDEQRFQRFQELHQGALLAGLTVAHSPEFEDWLQQEQDLFQKTVTSVLARWTDEVIVDQSYRLGLMITQVWLELEPWNEAPHRQRMQIFWQNKQRSAALLQYNICYDYLEEELGVEPSTETKQLYVQIQRDNPIASVSSAARYQRSGTRLPNNIPRPLTRVAGRSQEIESILYQLLTERCSLLSVVGEGGVGKTLLALTVGERVITDGDINLYYDGVWFVSCAGIEANQAAQEQLMIAIASTVGLFFQGTGSLIQQLLDYLANKAMLLILDNFEHLTAQAPCLLTLLERCHQLYILVTSRHDLRMQHGWTLNLTGLDLPARLHTEPEQPLSESELAQVEAAPSIQLLRERTLRAWPSFQIDAQNGGAAIALSHLLDGNPLALELAATLLPFYDLPTLFQELSNNYRLLAADLQDLPPRQRSIHATIDFSWRMLSPELSNLMAQCSVFRGAFTMGAITTITDASPQEVQQLVHRSFLHIDEDRTLHIHELVRQFAAEKLADDPNQQTAAQRKHSDYYIQQLIDWWEKAETKHLPQTVLRYLDNLYAAWDWAFQQKQYASLCRSIIPFTRFHTYAGLCNDTLGRIERYNQQLDERYAHLKNDTERAAHDELQVALFFARAVFHHRMGDYTLALNLFQQVHLLVHQRDYRYLFADIEHHLANGYRFAQKLDEAQHGFEQAIRYADEYQRPYVKIVSSFLLALIANLKGQHTEAEQHVQGIFRLLQGHPDLQLESMCHSYYADVYHAQGKWSAALASVQQSIAQVSQIDIPIPVHEYHSVGKFFWQSGRYPESKEYLERVDGTARPELYTPGTHWYIVWLVDFASLYLAWQDPEQALFYSQLATRYADKLGNEILQGRALKATGTAQFQLGKWEEAREQLSQARTLFQRNRTRDFECTALTQLVTLYVTLEEFEQVAASADALWQLLASGTLDMTNAEPIKAHWACYLGFRFTNDERADEALSRAQALFEGQLAHIDDEAWRADFTSQIDEHRQLQQLLKLGRIRIQETKVSAIGDG